MIIDDKLISKLEKLSRLKLRDEEKAKVKEDLNNMLSMFEKLNEINTENVEPLRYVLDEQKNTLRDDIVGEELSNEQALKNAKKVIKPFFIVPKFLKK
ncbi:MAG: Asp-tRNA(Asn)/Glu-tRNA(Gln) amidotransferase subunit GatC [Saprospiraceae bacterium]